MNKNAMELIAMGLFDFLGFKSSDEKKIIEANKKQMLYGQALFDVVSSAAASNKIFNKDENGKVNPDVTSLETGKEENKEGCYVIVVMVNTKIPSQSVPIVYIRINVFKDYIGLIFGRLAEKRYPVNQWESLAPNLKDYIKSYSDQGLMKAETERKRYTLFGI
jgi:hypothetical protein